MEEKDAFDFWYAVNNTEIVTMPSRHLETFGATIVNYHLVSELMDSVDQVRVRDGRMQFSRPQIVTPEAYSEVCLEGFGKEAKRYVDWLKEHEHDIRILQYGCELKHESFSEQIITDKMQTVADRVKSETADNGDPLGAVIIGVDDPWDVCLVKLFVEMSSQSFAPNVRELERQHLFNSAGTMLKAVRQEIEAGFLAASKDPSLINGLGKKLQQYRLFEDYQDRFFSLVKSSKK